MKRILKCAFKILNIENETTQAIFTTGMFVLLFGAFILTAAYFPQVVLPVILGILLTALVFCLLHLMYLFVRQWLDD